MDEKFKTKPGTPEIPTPKQAPIQLPHAPEKKKITEGLERNGKGDTKT